MSGSDRVFYVAPRQDTASDDVIILTRLIREPFHTFGKFEAIEGRARRIVCGTGSHSRGISNPGESYVHVQFAEYRVIKLGQVLQLEDDVGGSLDRAAHYRFTVFIVFDKLPGPDRSNVATSKRRTAIRIIEIGCVFVEHGPNLKSVADLPAPPVKRRFASFDLSTMSVGFDVFDKQIVRTFIGNLESDRFEQFRHQRLICRLSFCGFFGYWLAHYWVRDSWYVVRDKDRMRDRRLPGSGFTRYASLLALFADFGGQGIFTAFAQDL